MRAHSFADKLGSLVRVGWQLEARAKRNACVRVAAHVTECLRLQPSDYCRRVTRDHALHPLRACQLLKFSDEPREKIRRKMVLWFFEGEDGQRRRAHEIRREGWLLALRYFGFQGKFEIQQ